jgi:hypothetical protein
MAVLDPSPRSLFGMASAVILLALMLWGIKQPLVWIVVAFIAIGCGVGCAGYGVSQALLTSGPRTSQDVEWLSAFMGGSAGATTAGIVLLVVGLIRCRRSSTAKANDTVRRTPEWQWHIRCGNG